MKNYYYGPLIGVQVLLQKLRTIFSSASQQPRFGRIKTRNLSSCSTVKENKIALPETNIFIHFRTWK